MFTGRALLIPLLATTLLYSQNSAAPAAPDPGARNHAAPSANKSGKVTAPGGNTDQKAPEAQKYLVEVYPLPAFCLDRRDGSTTAMLPVAPATACNADQARLQAQNASEIEKALASDAEYSVVASGDDRVVIYRKTKTPTLPLDKLKDQIKSLARPPFGYSELVRVPPGTAKQIAPLVSTLDVMGISAEPAGNDHLLLKSANVPDKKTIADLKMRIRSLGWQRSSSPPTQRLFHLDAEKTVKNLAGAAADKSEAASSDKSGGSAKSGSADKSADASKATSATSSPSVSVTVTATGTQEEAPSKSAGQGDDQSADQSANQGADAKAPKSSAGDTAAQGKPSATAKVTSSAKSASDEPKPLDMQAVTDTLVYSNADGGDQGISERARVMTVLDLPRPEILLNLLSFQASSKNYKVVTEDADAVRAAVASHNQVLQDAIEKGWDSLSRQMKQSDFFDAAFYTYITQKFVLDQKSDGHSSKWMPESSRYQNQRELWGWCKPDTYCLGFAHAFEPLRPTFTNILLAIASAKSPEVTAANTIQFMTGECIGPACPAAATPPTVAPTPANADTSSFQECIAEKAEQVERKLDQEINTPDQEQFGDCESLDRLRLAQQVERKLPETLKLNCFKRQAKQSFAGSPDNNRVTTRVGLIRAAVADFLFNYKMATQYPHDFIPYDLIQSAQELNAEFNPLILSFNRDVAAFTQHLQAELECQEQTSDRADSKTFINDAMITVRGISGVESVVDTVTQNYFDATNPPNLTDLVQSISAAQKNVPGVLKANLTADEAAVLLGALNSVQPAQAKIGRELNLDVIPHALPGASSAELEVKLTNQETSDPTRYESGKKSEDDLSRVAKHNTVTRVRVESLKLFDVSSFSAKLQRPKSNFPLILPFFELPYFGSFLSWPLKGATEYHRSTAIVSAVIVPTAADLAFGIDFGADRICGEADPDYELPCHKAKSLDDLRGLSVRNFNKAMVQCFATGESVAYGGVQLLSEEDKRKAALALRNQGLEETGCDSLKLSAVPPPE